MADTAYLAAVIGAGPAGLFAARKLVAEGVRVLLFNRDIKPGGLAEYGIYPDKYKMKDGLRKQFKQIFEAQSLDYYGNIRVCDCGNLTIHDLMNSCFQAILVATGAQGTKWMGIPGEDLRGVYHAKDIVYHYNQLPPFSEREFTIGRRAALIGAGNVMMDVAHWLIREKKIDEVIAVVRRGPAEVKFTKDEMKILARNLDLTALEAELARTAPLMQAMSQDVAATRDRFLSALPKALDPVSETRFRFDFLASPLQVIGGCGEVCRLEVEENTLVLIQGETKARGTGARRMLEVDTVIFCIGDAVDQDFCLPTLNNAYQVVASPRYPVDGTSYEAYDPQKQQAMGNVFLTGWARQASTGLVGMARKDGENSAEAMLRYLREMSPIPDVENVLAEFQREFERRNPQVITKTHLGQIEAAEAIEAARRGLQEYKFASNADMLRIAGV
jgi:ferredoxin--NADP+ reductase